MALTNDQTEFYQRALEMARKQVDDLNEQMEAELAKVKERLAELENARDAAKQIYDGACRILGVENDLDREPAEAPAPEPEREPEAVE
jgi:hypothetical protein